jgi:hypothetical protein
MNQIPHLIAADIRRFRLLIIGMVLLMVSVAVLEGVRPVVGTAVASVELVRSLLSVASNVLALVLVALVIHADALVGSDAFWMTRPINPWALLASKALLLGAVMIAVPVLCEAGLLAVYGVPAGPVARIAAQTAIFDALWLAAAMSIAALTTNLARFAAVLGALIVGLAAVVAVSATVMMARFDDMPPSFGGMTVSDPTAGFVSTVLMIVACGALVVVQYRKRSRRRSIGVGAVGVVLAFVAAVLWPWPFLRPRLEVPEWTQNASALSLSADPASVEFPAEGGFWGRGAQWRGGRARVHLASVGSRWFARVSLRDASVLLDSGAALTSLSGGFGVAVPFAMSEEQPERVVLRELLQVQRLALAVPTRGESPIVLTMLTGEFARHAGASGSYRGRFQVDLLRDEIVAALPLRAGASIEEPYYRCVIDEISQRDRGTLQVRAHESRANSSFDRRPDAQFAYYLRNSHAAEAVAGSLRVPADETPSLFTAAFNVSHTSTSGIRGIVLHFPAPPPDGLQGESIALDDEWIANAELVIVRTVPGGFVQRSLEIPRFTLRPAAPPSVEATTK